MRAIESTTPPSIHHQLVHLVLIVAIGLVCVYQQVQMHHQHERFQGLADEMQRKNTQMRNQQTQMYDQHVQIQGLVNKVSQFENAINDIQNKKDERVVSIEE
jgi:uncharacterized protein HemX